MVNKLTIGIPANKRSVLRQMEDLLPQIEDGLARGYSHESMHAALPEVGINITLAYYHRVLHKLRKEQRDGKKAPTMPDLLPAPTQHEPAQALESCQTKTPELLNAIADDRPGQIVTISEGSEEPPLFKYRGKALLDRDFSTF